MLTATTTYKQAIHGPHKLTFLVDLYAGPGGALLENDVTIFGGSVSAALTHRVTRTGAFNVGPEFWPTSATSALTPYQTVVKVRAGIEYGDGSREVFPIIVGRVGDLTRTATGDVSVRVDDLAADVLGFRFQAPRNSDNVTVLNQIRRLISEALPSATFGTNDVLDAQTPKLTWDEDRGQALDNLAGALGGRWYASGNGDFVVRAYPYDAGTAVQTIVDGANGLLVTGAPTITRDGAANSVTVVVERFDGGTPFRVTATDLNPASPTRFGGPFGRVTQLIKVQTPLTLGQATTYANSQLEAATALSSSWTVGMVPDYSLEPGDTVFLESRKVSSTQVIDTITYPLGPGTMNLSTRAFVRSQPTLS